MYYENNILKFFKFERRNYYVSNKSNQLIEEVKEVKDLCLKQIGSGIVYMDDDTIALYQKSFKLLDTSMEVLREEAEIIESINKKLDKLLKK